MNNSLDINKLGDDAIEEMRIENEERQRKINAYLPIGNNKQPIYLVLLNKLNNISFDANRIDSGNGNELSFAAALNEFLKIETEYPVEFNAGLRKAVKMCLDSAIVNLVKPLNTIRTLSLYNAMIAIKIFLSADDFKVEYLNKMETDEDLD